VDKPLKSATHGQCNARPTVTFPAAGHHRPLTGTKLSLCRRTVNAMMNSNTGGTIYLDVGDDAKVHGLTLNMYKVPVLSLSSLFIVIVQFVTKKYIYTRCCLLLYQDTSVFKHPEAHEQKLDCFYKAAGIMNRNCTIVNFNVEKSVQLE